MTDSTHPEDRPINNAVVGHVPDAQTAEALADALASGLGIDRDRIAHGGDEEFASWLQRGADEEGEPGRLARWLTSLGQDREELVALGERVREGRHAFVVYDVEDGADKRSVTGVLQQFDVADATWFGTWANEDLML